MRFIVWGLGKKFEELIQNIELDDVVCFGDKNKNLWGKIIHGREIISAEQIINYSFDYIIITSNLYFESISGELLFEYGVPVEKMVSFRGYCALRNKVKYTEDHLFNKAMRLLNCNDGLCRQNNYKKCENRKINIKGSIYDSFLYSDIDIDIFQITHKNYKVINSDIYIPLCAGKVIHKELPYLGDDTGENISYLNSKINEATAMYWLWKNYDCKYIGINHYRRVFESPINKGWLLQKWEIAQLMRSYDIIVADAIIFEYDSALSRFQIEVGKEAFESSYLVIKGIFSKRSALEQQAFDVFINGNTIFPCNMMITNKKIYDEYCEWMFPIALEMVECVQIEECWDDYSKRVIGFWVERLFTIWLFMTDYKIKELPVLKTDLYE